MWAQGSKKNKSEAHDDLAMFGASPEKIKEFQEETNKQYEIFEENWETVDLFLRLTSQWNYSQGACIGLNYQSVEFLFRVRKTKNRNEILDGLQVMEFAALKIFHAKD